MIEGMDTTTPPPVQRLTLDTGGVWVVSSLSRTRYYLDLDRRLLLRSPGPGSSRGPYDDVWCHLESIESAEDVGVVEVGRRHRYTFDPDWHGPGDFIWWLQRAATGIAAVVPEDLPDGRNPGPSEHSAPFEPDGAGKDRPTLT